MNDDKKSESKNNNIYIIKSLFLSKRIVPTSDIFFIIFFSLKYIGLIVNSRIIEMTLNKNTISINKYLRNFLIFGKSLSPVLNNYQLITLFGAFFLLFYLLLAVSGVIYLKIKYSKINSLIEEKMEKINEKIEKNLFNVISFIYLIILFFHQYILEFYFFGFYSFIYYQMGVFSKNGAFSGHIISSFFIFSEKVTYLSQYESSLFP